MYPHRYLLKGALKEASSKLLPVTQYSMAPLLNLLTSPSISRQLLPSLPLSLTPFPVSCPLPTNFLSPYPTMKLIKSINPKQLFQIKKSRSIAIPEVPSFASSSSSSSDSSSSRHTEKKGQKTHRPATPTSVLAAARGISGKLSLSDAVASGDICFSFKLIDRDGDGKITKCELEALFSRLGASPPSEEETAAIMREIDIDGDGCISFEEFEAISPAFGPISDLVELQQTFEVFDANHDGKISAEELLKVFSAIGDEQCTLEDCKRMISSVDKNANGFVCFEDFARMMDHKDDCLIIIN
ncbi:hypothetical protein Ancab_012698 [Ancistrocladus abbreviatus]